MAYNNRAVIHYRDGNEDRAYADSEKAIATGIDELIARGMVAPELYSMRMGNHLARGRYGQAIADLDAVLRLRGDIARVHNDRAWLLATAPQAEVRNAREALHSAGIAVELADSPAHRDTLAEAYVEAGAFEEAIAEQERAIEMLREAGQTEKISAYQEALDDFHQGRPRRMSETDG